MRKIFLQWALPVWMLVTVPGPGSSRGEYPPLPETVTSFGAALIEDMLYVYGGHTGRAHQYYQEGQAKTLWRLNLAQPEAWKALGEGPGLQGLALVADGGKLYRIGGFTARNQQGEPSDLWSQADVASYDPAAERWDELPALPEPRSSFDAAVLDGKIYVIGGMQAEGGPTTRVDIYDPVGRQWQQEPSLQGQGMDGFGSSAFAAGDRLRSERPCSSR